MSAVQSIVVRLRFSGRARLAELAPGRVGRERKPAGRRPAAGGSRARRRHEARPDSQLEQYHFLTIRQIDSGRPAGQTHLATRLPGRPDRRLLTVPGRRRVVARSDTHARCFD